MVKRRIDEHHRPPGVAQAQIRHHPRERDEEQRRRHQVDEEDGDAQPFAPLPGQPRQAVGGRHRPDERDEHDQHRDDQRVAGEGGVLGPLEEVGDVAQCRRFVVEERVAVGIVEIGVLLEDGEDHPGEGQRREEREEGGRHIQQPARRHAPHSRLSPLPLIRRIVPDRRHGGRCGVDGGRRRCRPYRLDLPSRRLGRLAVWLTPFPPASRFSASAPPRRPAPGRGTARSPRPGPGSRLRSP